MCGGGDSLSIFHLDAVELWYFGACPCGLVADQISKTLVEISILTVHTDELIENELSRFFHVPCAIDSYVR